MKIERKFSPVVITVESPMESGVLVWALEIAMQTTRAAQDENVEKLLKQLKDNLLV
jgi:hypothetical protein